MSFNILEGWSLHAAREALTSGHCDEKTATAITEILAQPEHGAADSAAKLEKLQGLAEQIRHTPEGIERISCMNAYVRTLGRADNLAAFLESMRSAFKSAGQTVGRSIAERSQAGRTHCIYGWAAQSMLIATQDQPISVTVDPDDGVEEFMGYALPTWRLSIHIWQPNPEAVGFESTKRFESNAIVEPPHSHPFSFVSYVAVGQMRQSIYEESTAAVHRGANDRYGDVALERADGVWPPHPEYVPARLRTREDRVLLRAGESYFMRSDQIHDVEVDRATAAERPAITMFLCSESTQIPQAYMVPAMAEYHRENPEILKRAKALDPATWDAKLAATARYLRGEADHLRLGEIVQCGSSYAFMNA